MEDVDARIDAEEAVWQRLLEQAAPSERAKLHAMNPEEKGRLIKAASEHYADRLRDEDA
jgi:hypothetical protein